MDIDGTFGNDPFDGATGNDSIGGFCSGDMLTVIGITPADFNVNYFVFS